MTTFILLTIIATGIVYISYLHEQVTKLKQEKESYKRSSKMNYDSWISRGDIIKGLEDIVGELKDKLEKATKKKTKKTTKKK